MPRWLRNTLILLGAFIGAGIVGFVGVLLGIPDILIAVVVVVIGLVAMAYMHGDRPENLE